MTIRLVVISGGMASGKSVLAERLRSDFGCRVVKTSDIIRRHQSRWAKGNRRSLQLKGNKLDRETDFGWIADEVAREIRPRDGDTPVVLGRGAEAQQIDRILTSIGHRYVRHVHLSVDRVTQKQRFIVSNRTKDDGISFEEAINDASERQVAKLADKADIVIRTERHTEADVFCRVSARLNLQSRSSDPFGRRAGGWPIRKRGEGEYRRLPVAGVQGADAGRWTERGAQGLRGSALYAHLLALRHAKVRRVAVVVDRAGGSDSAGKAGRGDTRMRCGARPANC